MSGSRHLRVSGGNLSRHKEHGVHVWSLETPAEFGAKNPVLYVVLDNGIVKGIGIRKADGRHSLIPEAPDDRVAADVRAKWELLFCTD